MLSAQLLTTGTEITTGEVVNTNASFISIQLENMGVRVMRHLSVRDQREDILQALKGMDAELVFITGGLGPTTDDVTRECVARHCGVDLEFDDAVWNELRLMYEKRGLPLREAHRWQCYFPRGSERLKNPVGTALGFSIEFSGRRYFVMPGPPRELEGMWRAEVEPRLKRIVPPSPQAWQRWTCLGAPESEVAETLEPILKDKGFEYGYRAQIPYVRFKVLADPVADKALLSEIDHALAKWTVARGDQDPAAQLIELWPWPTLILHDEVTGLRLASRLDESRGKCEIKLEIHTGAPAVQPGIQVLRDVEEFVIRLPAGGTTHPEIRRSLPYKLSLSTERGRRSAAEWVICLVRDWLVQNRDSLRR